MDSLKRRGLSAVRPEIRAKRLLPSGTGGSSATDLRNLTPCLASVSVLNSPNSLPPGPSAPGTKNCWRNQNQNPFERFNAKDTLSINARNFTLFTFPPAISSFHNCYSRTSSQKPGLDNVGEGSTRDISSEHLFRVVPSHATIGRTASNEDDFTLIVSNSNHDVDQI